MTKEAMQQALEALENSIPKPLEGEDYYAECAWLLHCKAKRALKAEMAKPVQPALKLAELANEALTRVIAEQQKIIDIQKQEIDQNNSYLQKKFRQSEELKNAIFNVMNNPDNAIYRADLRDTLRNQGWCLQCEQMPCECED